MLSIAIHLAFAGSMRKGEILALTWDDIDFQKGTVSVSKTLKRVRRDAVELLNGKDILYQFPAVFDEGRTVTVLKRPKLNPTSERYICRIMCWMYCRSGRKH